MRDHDRQSGKKRARSLGKWGLALALSWMAWFLPQSLFEDCIHAVVPKDAGETELTEKEWKRLFEPQESKIVISWKFLKLPLD